MSESMAVEASSGEARPAGPYKVYSAGGLFTQDELAMNILLKQAVWRLSSGRFEVFLPQSRELQELGRSDAEAYIRNTDLLEVVKSDIVLARFDGLELDSGTVVEFTLAKCLGKPAVILRCDFRGLSGTDLTDPYNLMVKNWPRTVDVHIDSFRVWAGLFAEERGARGDSDTFQDTMKAELATVRSSVAAIAEKVIAGLEAVTKLESPYPTEYQEAVYKALRYSPGSGFDQLLTPGELDDILRRLRENGTL